MQPNGKLKTLDWLKSEWGEKTEEKNSLRAKMF